ncbi:hypothetical protein JHK85_010503 [Glycine max]|nr:hypothetical protein JHK85_010503 [Glycine max]
MGVANGSCNLHSNRKLQLQLPFRPAAGQLATTSGVFRATWRFPSKLVTRSGGHLLLLPLYLSPSTQEYYCSSLLSSPSQPPCATGIVASPNNNCLITITGSSMLTKAKKKTQQCSVVDEKDIHRGFSERNDYWTKKMFPGLEGFPNHTENATDVQDGMDRLSKLLDGISFVPISINYRLLDDQRGSEVLTWFSQQRSWRHTWR